MVEDEATATATAASTAATTTRSKAIPFREDLLTLPPSAGDGSARLPSLSEVGSSSRNPLGAIGGNDAAAKLKEDGEAKGPEPQDPLAGMSESDKWGFKGLHYLMNNYPDYNALMTGIEPSTLGLDLSSTE